MALVYGAPKLTFDEIDMSAALPSDTGIAAAIVFDAPKGTLDRRLIQNNKQFEEIYGPPTTVAHFSALAYLQKGSRLICKRVVKDALYGGVVLANNGSGSANSGISGQTDPNAYSFNDSANMLVTTDNPNAESYAITISYNRTVFGRGDGTANVFTLPLLTGNYEELIVEDDGVVIPEASYNIYSGNQISFNYVPGDGSYLNAIYDEFWFTTYKKLGTNNYQVIDAPFLVSRVPNKKDARGNNIYIEEVINNQTVYFKVYDNQLVDSSILPKEQITPLDFTGGSAGSTVTDSEIEDGWDDFANVNDVTVRLLINGGYCSFDDTTIHVKMIEIAQKRKDCFAVLDMPLKDNGDSLTVQQMADYSRLTLAQSTSYAALYADYCKVYDSYGDRELFIPPSGIVAGLISQTISSGIPWNATAGWNRGVVNCIELKTVFTEDDLDTLYEANVNPIRLKPGVGMCIWGQKTLLGTTSALSRINVRQLLLGIEYVVSKYLEAQIFELNTAQLRASIVGTINNFLASIRAKNGVYDFLVRCDNTNNTPESIDRNELNVDIFVKPTRVAEYIHYNIVVSPTGTSFSELLV